MDWKEDRFDIVPGQLFGNKLTVEHSFIAESGRDAVELFNKAVHRLLQVNDWDKITNLFLSSFQLTDSHGREIDQYAEVGDLVKINIPEPGSPSDKSFDWVKVETIEMKANRVAMRVRPVVSPFRPTDQLFHFFGSYATSTFQVFRKGLMVTAGVYGRNEVPHSHSRAIVEKLRNVGVAIGAITRPSRNQWESLVKGILSNTASWR